MLCQKCNKREATVHFKQVINGHVTEMNLCPECAEKENLASYFSFEPENMFSDFISDNIFGGTYLGEQKKCPECNMTLNELARTGRAGCAKCYDVFADEMSKIISGIHGNARHVGAKPGKHVEQIEKRKEIENLRKEQREAVKVQNYEKAAELRDRIRELEKGGEN